MANRGGSRVLLDMCLFGLVLQCAEASLVPAIFVFGDSTLDVGNNVYLKNCSVKAQANFPHYGIDFPNSTPTGRFSNGYNLADQLSQLLGFGLSPPPYLSLTEQNITSQMYKGINFASGGAGLLDNTGKQVCVDVISMYTQLQYFSSVVQKMNQSSGSNGTADFLSKSLFFISTGSNDLFEYVYNRGNDTEFLLGLTDSYKNHLKTLYGLGARKVGILSTSRLGCCPLYRLIAHNQNNSDGCYDLENDISALFYQNISAMLQDLSHELPGMNYSLGNAVQMATFVSKFPQTNAWNFTQLEVACCGSGAFGASGCNETAPVCLNRDNHLFWDAFHPTQAASNIIAQTLFNDTGLFVSPINVRQLVAM